ncbi:unnamed protein product [Mytilus edulis]|uniref:Uncharacterized protein n=1 Tax=Mytilus edulis TaxID=6550 RepID=A0A8S3US83_MYTED|nr:unnamed protein product [Mytilus edulis]
MIKLYPVLVLIVCGTTGYFHIFGLFTGNTDMYDLIVISEAEIIFTWTLWSSCDIDSSSPDQNCHGIQTRQNATNDTTTGVITPINDKDLDTRQCLLTNDIIDGDYTDWSEWDDCSQICLKKNTQKTNIVLKNDKHYMLHLDEYGYEEHGNDIPEECRISRTKFIHWARDVKRIPIVSTDLATTSFDEIIENEGELDAEDAVQSINVNKPNTANGSVGRNVHVSPVTEIKKDNGSVGLNSPLDQSVIEPTVQTAERMIIRLGSMNEPDMQGNTNPMVMSEDEPAIELAIRPLMQEEHKVHIQNLVEPAKERKTRDLDTEHVTALEEQFKRNLILYTVLIGHMPEKTGIRPARNSWACRCGGSWW